ncbi:extracellular solute-binding protein [Sinomonas sp. ASV486]|uniref:ABC transporter substrate-binding protein n=1 Tax=Sinomonas sp. ASV486 TaxID=3051170 RepID=UPI0027DC0F1A|nr:extracellular solute-binding protein [Sinomonas sp. ASV486]MDQ4489359.1 extracellular solute-binding protein [Sinomonas sp. ASV486]
MKSATLRLLGMATAVSIGALGLAGCGQGGGNDGSADGAGKTLNVLVGANANHAQQFQDWQNRIAAAFKKQTGADVKFETFASANDELQKIQTSVVSGQGADVYAIGTTFTPTAYSTGAFVKLDQSMWDKVGGRDRFVPATLGISGPDPQDEVGVPFTDRPYVLAYNTELFKKAGLDKPAATWDGLLEQAKKLTVSGVYGFSTGYADNYTPWKFAWTMANQAGNPLVDGNKARIDDPTVKQAYETYLGWLTKDKVVNPAALGWNDTQAAADFASGTSAMMLMTTASSKGQVRLCGHASRPARPDLRAGRRNTSQLDHLRGQPRDRQVLPEPGSGRGVHQARHERRRADQLQQGLRRPAGERCRSEEGRRC